MDTVVSPVLWNTYSLKVGTHEVSTTPAVHEGNIEESLVMVHCLSPMHVFEICN